jgi:hypothetical protein
MTTLKGAEIISFIPRPDGSKADAPSFQPHSIRRIRDGEVFTIGDNFVLEDGGKNNPTGVITGFGMLNDTIFISHTWSGVGFGWEGITKIVELPSQHQVGEAVKLSLAKDKEDFNATVIAVHFYKGKVKYDLEIPIYGKQPTRIYNIDSCFVLKS